MTPFLLTGTQIDSFDQYLTTCESKTGIARAHALGREKTIEEITTSGLRGRGGGGFPTGIKWSGISNQKSPIKYLVCNGAEGEPGTFKDRALIRSNPYQLIDGVAIAAFAIGAREAFICLKTSFDQEITRVTKAAEEFQSSSQVDICSITIVSGPEEYLYGEEKAMLEVIEGNDPLPRWLPPYIHGLFSSSVQLGWQAHENDKSGQHSGANPTLVNNVETLSNIPHIITKGAKWFRTMGTEQSPGTIITTVVGDVLAPDVGEVEMGTPLSAVIDYVGSGLAVDRTIKAVFSGVSNSVITPNNLDIGVCYEDMKSLGSGLGSAGFIVYDDTTCMVEVAHVFSRFLSVESCGQCPPCKLGSGVITKNLKKIQEGQGSIKNIEKIVGWLDHVTDGSRCYLATEERIVISSIMETFGSEFDEHILKNKCSNPRNLVIPKIVDMSQGTCRYDDRFWDKQPDWTYA